MGAGSKLPTTRLPRLRSALLPTRRPASLETAALLMCDALVGRLRKMSSGTSRRVIFGSEVEFTPSVWDPRCAGRDFRSCPSLDAMYAQTNFCYLWQYFILILTETEPVEWVVDGGVG